MKKLIYSAIFIVALSFVLPTFSFAQGTGYYNSSTDSAAIQSQQQEELEGRNILDNLSNKTISCSRIQDADFEKIGEYFMGQSIGDTSRHIAMNAMMKSMLGERGEEQAHIAMGKRVSGCDTSATFPAGSDGWMPMMSMMWGVWSSPFYGSNSTNNMMNFGFTPFGGFGWIFMILFWGFVTWMIVSMIRGNFGGGHMGGHSHGNAHEKSPLDILKERYAKGEIDKSEFEEKKKDLGV